MGSQRLKTKQRNSLQVFKVTALYYAQHCTLSLDTHDILVLFIINFSKAEELEDEDTDNAVPYNQLLMPGRLVGWLIVPASF